MLAAGQRRIQRTVREALHALQAPELATPGLVRIIQYQATALAGGDIFVGVKTDGDQIAGGADACTAPARTHGLRRILEHAQAVLTGDGVQRLASDRQTCQIHRQQHARARAQCALDQLRIDVARDRIDVDEHGPCAGAHDHVGS